MPSDAIDFCWSRIGIAGDGSCPELARVVHCRNCEVYARAGRALLDQPPPADYLEQWAGQLAAPPVDADVETLSSLVFRLGDERLALPTVAFVEAVDVRGVHRVPHRSGAVLLGVTNIRGELQLCVSLAAILGIEPGATPPPVTPAPTEQRPPGEEPSERGRRRARFAVIEQDGERWVFPVDELLGVHRTARRELTPPPATVAHDAGALTTALFELDGGRVALLDADRLFARLRTAVA